MQRFYLIALVAFPLCLIAAEPAAPPVSRDDAVRLQLFLDGKNFGPGKIDGLYGGFTKLSWRHYQQAQGQPPSDDFDPHSAELAAIDPLYLSYSVTAQDLTDLGAVPKEVADQSKLKSLPYTSLTELLGERFHCSVKFLTELNKGKNIDALKESGVVTVPNVTKPFYVSGVMAQRQQEGQQRTLVQETKKYLAAPKGAAQPPPIAPDAPPKALPFFDVRARWVHVSVKQSYLEVHEGEKIIAAFPITPGSTAIPSPIGTWNIEAKALMPEFRWDKSMLMTGKRSDDFHQLPSGPNNPVGVAWIALNKPGIGLHGTNEPDTIGRAASHGCIRLANWDAIKLYDMVDHNMRVVIE